MFSLIISIIAIALVAALAGASVYYGGAAFNKGTSDATYAAMVNQAEQINGAIVLYKVEGKSFTGDCGSGAADDDTRGGACMTQLIAAGFLSSIPEGEAVDAWKMDAQGALYTTTDDVKACIKANEQAGWDGSGTDADGDGVPADGTAGAICVDLNDTP